MDGINHVIRKKVYKPKNMLHNIHNILIDLYNNMLYNKYVM